MTSPFRATLSILEFCRVKKSLVCCSMFWGAKSSLRMRSSVVRDRLVAGLRVDHVVHRLAPHPARQLGPEQLLHAPPARFGGPGVVRNDHDILACPECG